MAVVGLNRIVGLLGRARLQMHVAVGLQMLFMAGLLVAGVFSPIGIPIGTMDLGLFVIVVIGVSWFSLLARSLQLGQMMHRATVLISRDQRTQAVPYLVATLEQFSLLRLNKLQAMLQLARIAHAQMDYPTAATMAAEVNRHDLARRRGLTVQACLLLADSLMELADAEGAGSALADLHGQKLRVAERLRVLPVLLRWQMMSGKYRQAAMDLEEKVQMAALLEAPQACLVHVLLAAASKFQSRHEVSRFLLRRAALHYDLNALAQRNPSVASYLVQLQRTDEPTNEDAGRIAHDHVACSAASQDLQQAVADPPVGPSCPGRRDCDSGPGVSRA